MSASHSGDDMQVGQTNESEIGSRLVGITAKGGYAQDYVLDVALKDDFVLTTGTEGVDAIHAKGSIVKSPGIQAGNGIVAQGVNGIVGYVHEATADLGTRDLTEEQNMQAGVLGEGGIHKAGVVGRGQTGVVGCHGLASRDAGVEGTENAGVVGYGDIGVTGIGRNGPGVHGIGTQPAGLSGFVGVLGESNGTGVQAKGSPALTAGSPDDYSGVFEANRAAPRRGQIWIEPLHIDTPTKLLGLGQPGELCVTLGLDALRRTAMCSAALRDGAGGFSRSSETSRSARMARAKVRGIGVAVSSRTFVALCGKSGTLSRTEAVLLIDDREP
jgi:hypothetical protein